MRDYLELGPAPPNEPCAQVGEPNYAARAYDECKQYIKAIRTYLGSEPEGAKLGIKWFEHDAGRYAECVVYFDPENENAMEYALACESKRPVTWEDAGLRPPGHGRQR